MTPFDLVTRIFAPIAVGVMLAVTLLTCAKAEQCPEGAKSCKVLVYTPEQEEALKILIQNTSVQGKYSEIKAAVDFYVKALTDAPAGTVQEPVKPRGGVADPPKP